MFLAHPLLYVTFPVLGHVQKLGTRLHSAGHGEAFQFLDFPQDWGTHVLNP